MLPISASRVFLQYQTVTLEKTRFKNLPAGTDASHCRWVVLVRGISLTGVLQRDGDWLSPPKVEINTLIEDWFHVARGDPADLMIADRIAI